MRIVKWIIQVLLTNWYSTRIKLGDWRRSDESLHISKSKQSRKSNLEIKRMELKSDNQVDNWRIKARFREIRTLPKRLGLDEDDLMSLSDRSSRGRWKRDQSMKINPKQKELKMIWAWNQVFLCSDTILVNLRLNRNSALERKKTMRGFGNINNVSVNCKVTRYKCLYTNHKLSGTSRF